ncbi:MAG: glutamine--fructose-6-phosphate transaminase (isomerizing) [Thermoplasmata archaeon HGW-Thermoplasmata-1]|nr:MAG: glutamine--fructose-6-phosphate transaminase (isomerizing) [Thermoplasmata archaeon HGW-Thermoplasmata-1]
MCGIIGYVGYRSAVPIIVEGLKRLEYRGYDSAGLSVISGSGITLLRAVGPVAGLEKKITALSAGACGIGHTRWATMGAVNEENAHPHSDCTGKIHIVHNGIIENFGELKAGLESRGHLFLSQTDSEAIAHLIEEESAGCDSFADAVRRALKKIRGSFATVVLCASNPDTLIAARHESPLLIGVGDSENLVASDATAVLSHTDRVIYLEDGDVATITPNSVSISDMDGAGVCREIVKIEWSLDEAEKSGYEHYMLKEINEQPSAIREAIMGRISPAEPIIDIGLGEEDASGLKAITLVGCGTSYYAGLAARHFIERCTGLPVNVEIASEYRYYGMPKSGDLVVAITQSGETADTLAAVKQAKKAGARVYAVTNVIGSTITRIADRVMLTRAGPEISVASTKAFTTQMVVLQLLALRLSQLTGNISAKEVADHSSHLHRLSRLVQETLERRDAVMQAASGIAEKTAAFYIGRGQNYPIALEGALKLKEISYVHAEGFAAGELKHGPLALIDENTPIVAIVAGDPTYEKTLSNIAEIKARGSPVIALAFDSDTDVEKQADIVLRIPDAPFDVAPLLCAVTLQLLAYYVAKARGCSIDRPRNLAKSVTVE